MSSGYKNFRFLYADSGYDFAIFPQGNFTETYDVEKQLTNAIDGSIHSFKIRDSISYNYSFPLSFINSSDTFKINNLWENQVEFNLFITNDEFGFNVLGRIINRDQPLSRRVRQNFDLFEGDIQFKSSSNLLDIAPLALTPFILDNPADGLLDGISNRI